MNETELIGIIIGFSMLSVSCVGLFLDSRRKYKDLEVAKEAIKNKGGT